MTVCVVCGVCGWCGCGCGGGVYYVEASAIIDSFMSYFPGVFITQYHKSRAGYFINHDLLVNGTRSRTQPLPKLATNSSSTTSPRTCRRSSTTSTQSSTSAKGTPPPMQERPLRQLHHSLDLRHLLRHPATHCRCSAAASQDHCRPRHRHLDRPRRVHCHRRQLHPLEDQRGTHARKQRRRPATRKSNPTQADKYHFGIFDFALAKKETHVQKLLEVYDANREVVHDS